ncbi:peptidoglycan-binding protein [Pelagibacterium sp.]|uniref:peptidoglycan-binding protein n=1 Tax=Pelagibacterium sp. TaxID=1967288 RepID=UPI003A95B2E4
MARTNPHHDWDEPQTNLRRSNGAEWESLRNELVALLDQVEDQVATSQATKDSPQPAAQPRPALHQPDRHSEALRSVRQAVSRLADRSPEDRPVMRESVVDAINQIRARQTGGAASVAPNPAPANVATASAPRSELADFARSLDAIGEKIAGFEDRIGQRIESLGENSNIAGQIDQLSEVIEMLAGAVGETGQIKRIEAQIGNLAELITSDRNSGGNLTSQRIEELTSTIEKLVTHQLQTSERDSQQAALADDRQIQAMAMIEQSVRSIYDRIDTLEASQSRPSDDIERLSRDMAALTEAVSKPTEPTSLLEKIDAISARISTIEAPSRDDAAMLAESVTMLRDVIAETIEPRFSQLEQRIETMTAPAEAPAIDAIEAQLRQIARRVDETGAQLKAMAELESGEAPAGPDLEALADMIASKTQNAPIASAPDADGVEKADLAALEDRLASLFSRSVESGAEASNLSGVRNSIAQVDNRIARLEAMLNSKPATTTTNEPETTHTAAPTPDIPRRKPEDAMPVDPATGASRRVLGQGAVDTDEAPKEIVDIAEPNTGFALDTAAIDRPAKPKSSLTEAQSRFETTPAPAAAPATANATPTVSNATRASFIEAARRSARQPAADEIDEPKSLIGRALARFQREETESSDEPVSEATPVLESSEPVVEPRHEDEDVDGHEAAAPSFFARNRRALLLGTAVIAVIALATPLVLGRIMPSGSAPQNAESAQVVEPQAPAQEGAPAADVSATDAAPAAAGPEDSAAPAISEEPTETDTASADDLMSNVRVIEQQPRLSAAMVDSDALTAIPTIDPMTTASIGAASGYAAPSDTATLPAITAPAAIEPVALRDAADEGDRFAQFEVGAILTEGTVVEQDFGDAAAWYERSAAQGFAPAQYRLGSLYEGGRGVERDLDMARLWYQRAAEAGNRMSMHNLASLYAGGELADQDFAAAAHWFEEAASRGLTDSQFNLGMLYARGLGVDQDFEKSYIWFSLAARSGDEDAANSRDDVSRSLEADAIQRLDATLAAWTPVEIDIAANFAPIGTWDDEFDPGPSITNRDVIMRVQVLLGKLGYDVGSPDGIPGPKTSEAVVAFERATGMNESGSINPRLLAVLGSQPV